MLLNTCHSVHPRRPGTHQPFERRMGAGGRLPRTDDVQIPEASCSESSRSANRRFLLAAELSRLIATSSDHSLLRICGHNILYREGPPKQTEQTHSRSCDNEANYPNLLERAFTFETAAPRFSWRPASGSLCYPQRRTCFAIAPCPCVVRVRSRGQSRNCFPKATEAILVEPCLYPTIHSALPAPTRVNPETENESENTTTASIRHC